MKRGKRKILLKTLPQAGQGLSAFVFSLCLALSFLSAPAFAVSNTGNAYNSFNGISGPVILKAVAVLPLENLTDAPLAAEIIRDYIKGEFKTRGMVSISDDRVVDEFLASKRIRYTGAITRATVREMGKALGVDAVLIGSVDYYSKIGGKVTVGVACRLVSAVDGNIIWAENITYTGRDFEWLLGFGVVKSLDILASVVVKDMISGIADKFFVREGAVGPFEIERVIIYPVIGKAEEKRELRVKFVPISDEPREVRAVVGDKEVFLLRIGEYEYEGVIDAPAADGTYHVDVVALSDSSASFTFDAAGEVTVDSISPKLDMRLSRNIFSTKKRGTVILEPRLLSVESIEEWAVEISNGEGAVVRSDRGYGTVPRRLLWRGESDGHRTVEDGRYTIRLTVKDLAGNESMVSNTVRVKNSPPVINVGVDVVDNVVLFIFDYDREEPIQSWQFSIADKDGNTLKKLEGEGNAMPEKFEYPLGVDYDIKNLSFTIVADDVAGNQFKLTKAIPSLFTRKMPFAGFKGKDQLWQDF